MRDLISVLMIASITTGLAACGATTWMDGGGGGVTTSMGATTTISPAAALPVSAVTENQLRADWTSQALGDRARLTGTVYNGWVLYARDIVLLVDSLDPGGQIARRTQVRLWQSVGPGASTDFDLTLPAASSYRVQVVGARWLSDQRS